ncbi:hypothetical protein F1_00058 [Ralstonia phage Heva]|uniref:Uncharacterized protein n=2 Tax=Cimandefvirus TaxID=2843366 RepID=A0A7G5BAU8_9CAUD|nr:hypothetical protein KMC44_gp31 [Ralstonia phage Cimandef]YP_010078528.1 hypothetical protein KMC48_gp32 [Ralstonia phage Heva]QMV32684.1 hypothetical protein B2_00050 [Ralstonia phage Cimandef]QMV32858.1 hypothetical protein D1_00032 [Ralstonia phage Dimitile]QMV33421.1 hypothetical protein F1_00058 [Ralstonia phage Heva]
MNSLDNQGKFIGEPGVQQTETEIERELFRLDSTIQMLKDEVGALGERLVSVVVPEGESINEGKIDSSCNTGLGLRIRALDNEAHKALKVVRSLLERIQL